MIITCEFILTYHEHPQDRVVVEMNSNLFATEASIVQFVKDKIALDGTLKYISMCIIGPSYLTPERYRRYIPNWFRQSHGKIRFCNCCNREPENLVGLEGIYGIYKQK